MQSDAAVTAQPGLLARTEHGPLAGTLRWLLRLARRKPLGFAGLVILAVFALTAALAPLVTPYGYEQTNFRARLQGPSRDHIFGTDNLGRDLFSRIVWGARVSFGVSLAAVLIAKSLGTLVAVVSGYYGGWFDKLF